MQKIGCLGALIVLAALPVVLWGLPQYNVWAAELSGRAELRKAEQNRQIAVEEAKAQKESAQCLADAEIIRAEGVAKANKIIGDSLKGNQQNVIYVPTEAGLPILEAGKRDNRIHKGEIKHQ